MRSQFILEWYFLSSTHIQGSKTYPFYRCVGFILKKSEKLKKFCASKLFSATAKYILLHFTVYSVIFIIQPLRIRVVIIDVRRHISNLKYFGVIVHKFVMSMLHFRFQCMDPNCHLRNHINNYDSWYSTWKTRSKHDVFVIRSHSCFVWLYDFHLSGWWAPSSTESQLKHYSRGTLKRLISDLNWYTGPENDTCTWFGEILFLL